MWFFRLVSLIFIVAGFAFAFESESTHSVGYGEPPTHHTNVGYIVVAIISLVIGSAFALLAFLREPRHPKPPRPPLE